MNEQSPWPPSYLSSVACFLAGGIAGAGLSLLLAPRSGKDTRQLLASRLKEGADSARSLRDRAVTRGEEAWDEAAFRLRTAASAISGERKDGKTNEIPTAL
jgi:gas vesicle protein